MTTAEIRRARRRGVAALSEREVLRVLRLWSQTIAPPIVAAVLFIVVFGVALGSRIPTIDGMPYEQFIVPGLVLMGVATAAFGNNATSIFQARNDGFIEDPASSPMTPSQLLIGYLAGGVVRSLLIGVLTLAAARAFVDFPVEHPFVLGLALLGTSLAFTSLGTVVGLYSTGWDQQNVVGNLVIQPLVFLGGVFYSIESLAEPWRALTHADPIFYMVVAARHGMLGSSDVDPLLSVGVTLGLAAAMTGWAWWTFRRGVGIRT
ncbi:ABC transporter permease [Miltoncostaea marina]|uniref:ABC transporter permease n=1 Tax=Miltoncostaea marina TaxID=2843215 RepID=UPI001C3CA124|nr:ABC transporter permease [Miltoncostaea marina]